MPERGIRTHVRRLLRLPLRTSQHIEADAREELRAFIAERVDDLVARGVPIEEAHAEALRRLGQSFDETTELLHHSAADRERRMRLRDTMTDFTQDLRYAVRTLRRDLGFTTFAVMIVAVGIAASVTVFSVANALLLRPLPFQNPDDLVWVANGNSTALSGQTIQVNHFLDFEAQSTSYSGLAAYFAFYGVGDTKLSSNGDVVRLSAVPVSQKFFPLLGVRPIFGRGFTTEESAWNGPKAVLLSYRLWQRRFSSDPSIVGRPITLNDESVTVVGILPESFDFGSIFAPGAHIDLFTPFPLTAETNRWGNTIAIVGRLKPGATLRAAAGEASILASRITAANPNRNSFNPTLMSLRSHVSGRVQSALTVLVLAVGVVMLIVCANLSNLLLARATTRQKEMAIRAALGAGRRRLVRQMLTESVVLSSTAAVIGLTLAVIGTRAIAHMSAVSLPLLENVRIDTAAVLFTVALALVAGLAFGVAPALQIPEAAVNDALKVSGRAATHGKRGQAMRRGLVVAEIALACVLLVGSGLLIRSFINVLDVDLGFRPDMVAAVRVDPDRQQITSAERFGLYLDDVMRLSKAIPGVQSVAIADGLPLGSNRSWGARVKGREYKRGEVPSAFVRIASEGFIEAMGMTLRTGREFTSQDVMAGEPVIMINETAARTLWPGENAIGKVMIADKERRVVGIVGDVRHLALEEAAGMEMYLPTRQTGDFSSVTLIVRSKLPTAAIGTSLRTALASVSPNLPTNEIRTLGQIVDKAVSPRRFFTLLLGGFAAFALTLALLGIYGVISYTVSHRTQEIGVRIAVGASAGQIQGKILRETLGLAAIGMVLGTVGSWIATRALGGMLFGVSASDPMTFVAMLVVITLVATLSGYLPARRASRIDPLVALRSS